MDEFAQNSVRWGRCLGVSLALAAATTMTACSSGSGGDNAVPDKPPASGAVFAYPYNGQQDVTLASQIVVKFNHGLSGDAGKALALRAGSASSGNTSAKISADKDSSDDQAGILTITPADDLKPNTTYYIVATQDLSGTSFGKGDTITQFTTGPMPGRPAASDQLKVVETSPGNVNPVTHEKTVFTEFNSVRVVFSEPVDPSTVVAGDTFKLTGPGGDEVPGRLTVIGHELTFDPADDLKPGKYKLALTDGVTSEFGKALKSYSETKTVLSAGQMSTENLTVTPSSSDVGDLPDNVLDGGPVNLVRIANQLIGLNKQPASNSPAREGLTTTLAEGNQPGFGNVIPATIRAGQKFQLTPLNLKLNGQVQTGVRSGPIQVQFANDADVYLMANDLSDVTTPTAVRLRFDLAISTLIEASGDQQSTIIQTLANGLFNQSVLNIQAAGLAIPQENGDLKIDTLGSFPILVNRTDRATVDFELSLTLSAADQVPVKKDTTAPYLASQSPSACLYVFGTPAYDGAYAQSGASPTALPEQKCVQILQGGGITDTQSEINNFPVESSPALIFSEPVDPATVNDNSIQLTSGSGNAKATYQVDGSSVVIHPQDLLQPNTQYTITLGSGQSIKDAAGNKLTDNQAGGPQQSIKFTTEPLVDAHPTPPILGELSPGVPCALDGGDFTSGGDTAGQCVGDAGNDTTNPLPVFQSPANVPVNASFSKLVAKDSIVLADGCLTSGGNDVNGATVALEKLDGSGQCTGTPDASIAFANRNGDMTQGFSIRPAHNLEPGSRYQIVICGNEGSVCSNTIMDADGYALNTDPFKGTGSTDANSAETVAGGPDIVMPFDVTKASTDYYADQFTLPAADANGNGRFDDGERPQPGNRALARLNADVLGDIDNPNRPDGLFPAYLSLNRPIAIRKALDDCSATSEVTDDENNNVIGGTPKQCIQVSLLPGGFSALTNIHAQSLVTIDTGRTILRSPRQTNKDGSDGGAQSGYIVPECQGDLNGQAYDYSPCFVAHLDLVANVPDASNLTSPQQNISINVFGPVTFEQNGRLVISLRNANSFQLEGKALGVIASRVIVSSGNLHYQLVGNAAHGGRAYPQR